jgi:7,8-dihydropterin-6-yl-methyl-4-(beta-D-ribofuranosyl)aminobenzene 5'-phosphate synthase
VNICLHALELFPGFPIETIIGGLHLVEAEQEKIDLTAKALEDMNPAWIASGHCTGFRAQFGLFQTFRERFEPLASGKVFRL